MDIEKDNAVIVLHDIKSDNIILTKRSINLKKHPGEVCFPGGAREKTDENLWHTALRELAEELNIAQDRVTYQCELNSVTTALGFNITPFLGEINNINPFAINQEEVEKVILVPKKVVTDVNNYEIMQIQKGNKIFKTLKFTKSSELIWGATARIMHNLATT